MGIWIVIAVNEEDSNGELLHMSFTTRAKALRHAILVANNTDHMESTSLHSIIYVETVMRTINEYELKVIEGKFDLEKI